MPPKQRQIMVEKASSSRRTAPKGYFANAYGTLTAPENASVVRSVAIFGVAVAFFSSSFSEWILPPL